MTAKPTATVDADRLHGLLRTEKAYEWLKAGAQSITAHAEQFHPHTYEAQSYADTLRRALSGAEKIERTGEEPTFEELGYGKGETDDNHV